MSDAVDEVVARLGGPLPAEVWVVYEDLPYESGEFIGLARTLEKAKELGEEHENRYTRGERKKIAWTEVKTNSDGAGKTYTWVEAPGTYVTLSLEEIQ